MMNPFEPHPLFRGGQLQTLAAFLFPRTPELRPDEYMTIPVSGDDVIELAVNNPPGEVKGILYLLHGLGGDAKSAYKLRITQKLLPRGYRMVRHNHRGGGEQIELAKGLYHSGATADILAGLHAIQKRWPGIPIGIVGFSLSGTILLNLLARHPDEISAISELKSAMSVCAPLDLHASAGSLALWRNKHYDFFFAKTLLNQLRRRKYLSEADIKAKFSRPTLRKVDEFVTAPYAGYRDAAHYYDSCSPLNLLGNIRLPTLILAASDDPVVPAESVVRAQSNDFVTVRMERSGGHMGFLGRHLTPHKDYRWMDYFIETWAEKLLK